MAKGNPAMSGDVVVVGGGNVAVDCARNAKRRGADYRHDGLARAARRDARHQRRDCRDARGSCHRQNGWGPKEVLVDEPVM
jgi:NADPH-dependent glutamate synthase beta subunit-like oxidoreductase